ncbi:hypothetical protein M2161_005102 [Streptomyces sp. SAI-133]|nr:hypothetical protein [Streptomyces sp. SAI-133]
MTVPKQAPPAGAAAEETPVSPEAVPAEAPVTEPEQPTSAPVAEEPAKEAPAAEEPPAVTEAADEKQGAEEVVAETTEAVEAPEAAEPAVEEPVAEEPAPASVDEAEPQAAEAEPAPEPETAPEPAVAEVTPAPEPEPEPVAEVVPAPEPETVVEPESKPEPEPEPEPVAEVAAPVAAEHAPATADGEDAPQGPPAADDESGTGAAGGNDDDPAEGRSVTVPPTLRTAHDAAATTLAAHDLTGTAAKTYLVLDRSASMRPYYKDGSAQALGEQTLALAAHLDPESTVHVVFFSTELDGTGELTLTDHENKIDELHAGLGRMGRTSYHAAVAEVLAHHTKENPGTPALVVFQTDGAPDAKTPATQALTEAAKSHPTVFFSFVAFGDPENKAFDYLRKLKLPNTSHFLAGETPKELTDAEVYEGILANWRP